MTRVLVVGFSARAAAESAARAGFAVTAADEFNDLDQHPSVKSISLAEAQDVQCDAVVYLANFENRPRAVEKLARGRALWGNPPDVLRRVRTPPPLPRLQPDTTYLVKPIASGGGHGIAVWDGGAIPPRHYLQERIDGVPGSIVFVAAGGRAVPLGVTKQLVGEAAFGASGYQYCGNLLGGVFDDAVAGRAAALASAVTDEFGLVGVNGIDFIARDGVPYPIEVNPRWCASMELVERVYGVSVFGAHAAACTDGRLPATSAFAMQRAPGVHGKAIVFARADRCMGDTRAWLGDPSVRDVPPPGQRISKGRPICTVFATGSDAAACREALIRRAEAI